MSPGRNPAVYDSEIRRVCARTCHSSRRQPFPALTRDGDTYSQRFPGGAPFPECSGAEIPWLPFCAPSIARRFQTETPRPDTDAGRPATPRAADKGPIRAADLSQGERRTGCTGARIGSDT
ncbi:hypothetical protein SKAU_G00282740 [Synaphobranchus kaupii]|uniref:Uncharacterized protein n=1 Tax=Synaphobranchus kaupii TaxID=118154 RepID=A0A9Q1EXL4_SYNKA|nr:hypothetical protein SKAU_G00282740 [Synaphobranchus kaupii]